MSYVKDAYAGVRRAGGADDAAHVHHHVHQGPGGYTPRIHRLKIILLSFCIRFNEYYN